MPVEEQIQHLYVHMPFCPKVCPYCCFHVLPVERPGMDLWLKKLMLEFRDHASRIDLKTVFFGGGTPTALSLKHLRMLLPVILREATRETEVTMECNPSTLTKEKASLMIQFGVNRLSIGVQSMDPDILKKLGRTHSVQSIRQCVLHAREGGFTNLNLDLIFGVPGQSLDSWKQTLEAALSLHPEHLSCYGLTYEEDTEFFIRHQRGEMREDMELERDMFEWAHRLLTAEGYNHYEISNYARPGFECRHNLACWMGQDYIGIGPSAVGTWKGVRRKNSLLTEGGWKVEEEEILTPEIQAVETMVLGLRTQQGVNETQFQNRFGFVPSQKWQGEIGQWRSQGLMELDGNLRLTQSGRLVADEIAVSLMTESGRKD